MLQRRMYGIVCARGARQIARSRSLAALRAPRLTRHYGLRFSRYRVLVQPRRFINAAAV